MLRAAAREATTAQWQLAADEEVVSRSALEAQGVEIIELDDAGRALFKQAVRGVIEQRYADLPDVVLRATGSSPVIQT